MTADPTVKIVLPDLHPKQQIIVNSNVRFKVVICGRRFGKTTLIIDQIIDTVFHGQRGAYFAPTHKMATDVWEELKNILAPMIGSGFCLKNESERWMRFKNGAVIDFWSLNNYDSVRGRKYHHLFIDEAALLPDMSIWRKVLRPTLLDFKGSALFATTPRGGNWVHELYSFGLNPEMPDWDCWQFKSIDNPYLDPEEIENAKIISSEREFAEEYLAEFVSDQGTVFRNVDEIMVLPFMTKPTPGKYIFGVDWGRQHDYTVISIWDVPNKKQVFQDRFSQIGFGIQRGRLKILYEKWKPFRILAEENSIGLPNIEELQMSGYPVEGVFVHHRNKGPLIDALSLAIERGACTMLDDEIQKSEFKAYEMKRSASGNFQYSAPSGIHDDTVMANAIAWSLVNRFQKTRGKPFPRLWG